MGHPGALTPTRGAPYIKSKTLAERAACNPTRIRRQNHAAGHGPKQLGLVPDAGHGESFFPHRDDYEHQVKTFCGIHNPVN